MPDERIEFSGSGLKLSYLRFLADGTAGLIMILLLLLGYYQLPPGYHISGVGREVKIFVLIVLVALAVPLGLLINTIGWFLLGGLQVRGATFWFEKPLDHFLVRATNQNFRRDLMEGEFGLTAKNFYEDSQLHGDTVLAFFEFVSVDIAHVKGIKRLIRSMSIIVLLAIPIFYHFTGWWCLLGVVVADFLLLSLLTLLEFYERLGMLEKAFILALDESSLTRKNQGVLRRLVKRGMSRLSIREAAEDGKGS